MLDGNSKVNLLPWEMNFLDELVMQANNKKVVKFLRDLFPNPYTHSDGELFINTVAEKKPIEYFAIFSDGKLCGGISINPLEDVYQKNAEIAYWLGENFWGRGIMTESIKQIIDYGFVTFPIERIYASVFEGNKASMKALEKAGFTLEGVFQKTIFKNNKFLNEHIYGITKQKHRTEK